MAAWLPTCYLQRAQLQNLACILPRQLINFRPICPLGCLPANLLQLRLLHRVAADMCVWLSRARRQSRVYLLHMSIFNRTYPIGVYRLVLACAAAIWGLGFVIGKGAIETIGATWFTAVRFLGAGIVLTVILFPHIKRHFNRQVLKAGCIIGLFSFMGFWTQFLGLGMTTPSKNAFLSACYCLTVPFIWWVVARRRPATKVLVAAMVCAVGIGLVSLTDGFSVSAGDGVSILSAFLYGAEIVVIGLVMRDNDVLTVTTIQQFTSGFLALALAIATQPAPTASAATPELVGAMAYVCVLSAAFGAVAQNLAQAHVSPAEAGLLCSLESVFCALFSVAFFGEVLTPRMGIGFVLIFGSIALTQLGDKGDAGDANVLNTANGEQPGDSPAQTLVDSPRAHKRARNRGRIAR